MLPGVDCLTAPILPACRQPAINRVLRDPDRQASALPQRLIVRSRVHHTPFLPLNVMTTTGVMLERHRKLLANTGPIFYRAAPCKATIPDRCNNVARQPDPKVVGRYLTAAVDGSPDGAKPVSVATLERRLAALGAQYRTVGLTLDRTGHIADLMAGIRRTRSKPPKQKEALLAADIRR